MGDDMKTIEKRLIEWFVSGDTGLSSEAIAAHMSGAGSRKRMDYPSDPSDLGRCLRLLDKIPEWKDRIGEMSQYSPGWAGLVKNWDKISKSMEDEAGINWQKAKSAPITYDMMKLAEAEGFLADDRFECQVYKSGHLSSWRKKK